MKNLNYNDFKNICRTCMRNCDMKFTGNSVILNVYHKLTDIHFEANDELPQQICFKCFEKIHEIQEFALQCKETYSSLLQCLANVKIAQIKEESNVSDDSPFKIEEIIIDDRVVDLLDVEASQPPKKCDIVEIKEDARKNNELDGNVENTETSNEKNNLNDLKDVLYIDLTENNINAIKTPENKYNNFKETIIHLKIFHKRDKVPRPDRPFACETCSKTFRRKNHLKSHMVTHSDERPYGCTQCAKRFRRADHLRGHMAMHSGGERPHKCPHCGKAFMRADTLRQHLRTHSGERPHKCPVCAKAFLRTSNLKVHLRTHTGVRSNKCPECDKMFAQTSDLRKHLRTHTGERPYKCEQCAKMFSQRVHLDVHTRLHNGERPYTCAKCPRTFLQSSNLKQHVRVHNRARLYRCAQCKRGFADFRVLCAHKRELHGNGKLEPKPEPQPGPEPEPDVCVV